MSIEQTPAEGNIDLASLQASMDAARKFEKDATPVATEAPKEKVVVTDPEAAKALEPKPEQEPKAESKSEPKDEGKGIKALRTELEARGEKLKSLEQQLAEFEGTKKERDELKGRIETLERERERLSKIESVAALEQSPEFQQKYVDGRNGHLAKLQELAGYADIDFSDLQSALGKSGRERVAAMEEILAATGRYIAEDIVQEVKMLDRLDAERASELANASEALKRRVEEREYMSRKQLEEIGKVRTEAWRSVESKLASELQLSDDIKNAATEFYNTNRDAAKAAEITLKGHAFDALNAKLAELQKELSRYQKQTPGVSAGVRATEGSIDDNLTVAQRINKQLEEMGFSRR